MRKSCRFALVVALLPSLALVADRSAAGASVEGVGNRPFPTQPALSTSRPTVPRARVCPDTDSSPFGDGWVLRPDEELFVSSVTDESALDAFVDAFVDPTRTRRPETFDSAQDLEVVGQLVVDWAPRSWVGRDPETLLVEIGTNETNVYLLSPRSTTGMWRSQGRLAPSGFSSFDPETFVGAVKGRFLDREEAPGEQVLVVWNDEENFDAVIDLWAAGSQSDIPELISSFRWSQVDASGLLDAVAAGDLDFDGYDEIVLLGDSENLVAMNPKRGADRLRAGSGVTGFGGWEVLAEREIGGNDGPAWLEVADIDTLQGYAVDSVFTARQEILVVKAPRLVGHEQWHEQINVSAYILEPEHNPVLNCSGLCQTHSWSLDDEEWVRQYYFDNGDFLRFRNLQVDAGDLDADGQAELALVFEVSRGYPLLMSVAEENMCYPWLRSCRGGTGGSSPDLRYLGPFWEQELTQPRPRVPAPYKRDQYGEGLRVRAMEVLNSDGEGGEEIALAYSWGSRGSRRNGVNSVGMFNGDLSRAGSAWTDEGRGDAGRMVLAAGDIDGDSVQTAYTRECFELVEPLVYASVWAPPTWSQHNRDETVHWIGSAFGTGATREQSIASSTTHTSSYWLGTQVTAGLDDIPIVGGNFSITARAVREAAASISEAESTGSGYGEFTDFSSGFGNTRGLSFLAYDEVSYRCYRYAIQNGIPDSGATYCATVGSENKHTNMAEWTRLPPELMTKAGGGPESSSSAWTAIDRDWSSRSLFVTPTPDQNGRRWDLGTTEPTWRIRLLLPEAGAPRTVTLVLASAPVAVADASSLVGSNDPDRAAFRVDVGISGQATVPTLGASGQPIRARYVYVFGGAPDESPGMAGLSVEPVLQVFGDDPEPYLYPSQRRPRATGSAVRAGCYWDDDSVFEVLVYDPTTDRRQWACTRGTLRADPSGQGRWGEVGDREYLARQPVSTAGIGGYVRWGTSLGDTSSQNTATEVAWDNSVGYSWEVVAGTIVTGGSETWSGGTARTFSRTLETTRSFEWGADVTSLPSVSQRECTYHIKPYMYMNHVTSDYGVRHRFLSLDYLVPDDLGSPAQLEDCLLPLPDAQTAAARAVEPAGPAPRGPEVRSASHAARSPSSNPTVMLSWGQAADDPASIAGYGWAITREPDTIPPERNVGPGTDLRLGPLPSGEWYFHVMALDETGRWGEPSHFGPIVIR